MNISTPGSGVAVGANVFGAAVTFEDANTAQLGATTGAQGPAHLVLTASASLASQQSLASLAVLLSIDPVALAERRTFLEFKDFNSGIVLSNDQAMADAIATLGPTHGTLIRNEGTTVHLTQTVEIGYSMLIEAAGLSFKLGEGCMRGMAGKKALCVKGQRPRELQLVFTKRVERRTGSVGGDGSRLRGSLSRTDALA